MNFWEARQAALEGKKVKLIQGKHRWSYTSTQFLNEPEWNKESISAEWEIVEEPKTITRYLNVYADGGPWFSYTSKCDANLRPMGDRIGCLKITVDENGKLISARNV